MDPNADFKRSGMQQNSARKIINCTRTSFREKQRLLLLEPLADALGKIEYSQTVMQYFLVSRKLGIVLK